MIAYICNQYIFCSPSLWQIERQDYRWFRHRIQPHFCLQFQKFYWLNVRSHGCRFHHGSLIKCKGIWQDHQSILRHHKEILSGARRLKALDLQFLAGIVLALNTRAARSANQLRPCSSFLPWLCLGYSFPNGFNSGRIFVSLHYRVRSSRVFTMKYVNITATYPYFLDF